MATVSKTNTEADYFSDENVKPSMDKLLQPIDSNLFKIEEELKLFAPARPANASLNRKRKNSVVLETNSYSNPNSSPAAKRINNLNTQCSSPVRDAVPSVLMNKKPIDQSAMSLALEITRRGRGRPKGSKNKTKDEKIVKVSKKIPLVSEPPSYEQFSSSLPLTYSNPASPPLQDKFASFSQNQYQTQPNQWNYVNSQQEYRTLSENYNIYGNNSEDQFCLTLL